jgi:uncharacterized protein
MSKSEHKKHRRLQPVPLSDVIIDDAFWTPRIKINREHTLAYQLQQCEDTGRISNFDKAAGVREGEFEGIFFNDSDVYKWMEAVAYSLSTHPDTALEAKLDQVIARVAAAQQDDGYLNTYFMLVEPDKKWTNLGVMHELYCAGHLFQAAVAHYQATKKRTLLDVACRFADHIDHLFGPGKRTGMPGHEEIELALMDLYRITDETRYMKLAEFFIDQRGQRPSVFEQEIKAPETGGKVEHNRTHFMVGETYSGAYAQDHLPVRAQDEVVGHAVRAMYLYCGMADVVGETGDPALRRALEKLWHNVTRSRMYVTGGIGPSSQNEGFTQDYHLPNTTAYAETCAAVGNIIWNWRLLMLDGEARFADVMELALYNGFLSGVAIDGKHFFYVNPLRSNGDKEREGWFGCACCPPNVARLLASLGLFAYGQSDEGIWTHLYIAGQARAQHAGTELTLKTETRYPWDGEVKIIVESTQPVDLTLHLRIPGWCRAPSICINGTSQDPAPIAGTYAPLKRTWMPGDTINLSLPMPVERIEAHPNVTNNQGKVALKRGPLMYCLEEIDHTDTVHSITLPEDTDLKAEIASDLLGGITVIRGKGQVPDSRSWNGQLYRPIDHTVRRPIDLTAIPYYAWNNRGKGHMTTWIHKD